MALSVLLASGVAQAIINGQPDRGAHPYVGMVYNAKGLCSGTLISPRVFLTAAHCTQFFEAYKRLEGDEEAQIRDWIGLEETYELIRECMKAHARV